MHETLNVRYPDPPEDWERKFHPVFGWGRMQPGPTPKGGILFHPEQAVEWNRNKPNSPHLDFRDRVQPNEPVFLNVSELRDSDILTGTDALIPIALAVKRIDCELPCGMCGQPTARTIYGYRHTECVEKAKRAVENEYGKGPAPRNRAERRARQRAQQKRNRR